MVKSGVPFDVAFSADPGFVLAWCIASGIIDGGRFNWGEMRWERAEGV